MNPIPSNIVTMTINSPTQNTTIRVPFVSAGKDGALVAAMRALSLHSRW